MGVRLSLTDCDKAGYYIVPNVILISPRDLVSTPDNMDETVLHTLMLIFYTDSMSAVK